MEEGDEEEEEEDDDDEGEGEQNEEASQEREKTVYRIKRSNFLKREQQANRLKRGRASEKSNLNKLSVNILNMRKLKIILKWQKNQIIN